MKQTVPTLKQVEQQHIDACLRAALGNKTLAAKLLGIDRSTLNRKLARRSAGHARGKARSQGK